MGRPVRDRSPRPVGRPEQDHRPPRADVERRAGARFRPAHRAGAGIKPGARELIMRAWGRYYRPHSPTSVQEAPQDCERALAIDPGSVDARIGIATLLLARVSVGWSSSGMRDQARAEQLLLEGLERDASRSMAHVAMGVLRRIQLRFSESK